MTTLKQVLNLKLTKKQLLVLPTSFDIIGDIVIFSNFPEELKKKEKLIANTLLNLHKNIKVVAKKTKHFSGKYRLQKVKILAGEKRKITLHKENNIIVKLNIETCYFSQRLATERLRIAKQIKPNESVLVMFSGIAIYPLVISKNSKAKEIYAIEINPEAHKYAQENLKLNKTTNITLFKGNVKTVIPKIKKKFDRILMPLPKSAEDYFDLAIKKIKNKGIIHFYDFQYEEDIPKKSIEKIKKHTKNFKILKVIKCGQYSPRNYRICLDIKLITGSSY